MMVWVFTGVLGVYKVVVGARCVLGVPAVTVTDCCGDEGLHSDSVCEGENQRFPGSVSSGAVCRTVQRRSV